jgi:hypothetical protein
VAGLAETLIAILDSAETQCVDEAGGTETSPKNVGQRSLGTACRRETLIFRILGRRAASRVYCHADSIDEASYVQKMRSRCSEGRRGW